MKAILFQVPKSAMQSGKGDARWKMVFQHTGNLAQSLWKDDLMGWTSTNDTLGQVILSFDSVDEAIAYATHRDIQLDIRIETSHPQKIRSYADNFRYNKPKFFG